MPVDLQNRLFKYFTDTLTAIVSQAKKTGRYDMGILGEPCRPTSADLVCGEGLPNQEWAGCRRCEVLGLIRTYFYKMDVSLAEDVTVKWILLFL